MALDRASFTVAPREIFGLLGPNGAGKTTTMRILLTLLKSTGGGGTRRKLELAMSMVNVPAVLFLDEPTTGLDIAARRDLWAYVRRIRDAGTAVVLTTHHLEEADVLCDRPSRWCGWCCSVICSPRWRMCQVAATCAS